MLLVVIIVSAFILSFALACGLGANDVSNAFATSIGAKVLSLRNAFIIASVAEMLGSIALGGLVTEKIIRATLIPGILTPWETMMAMEASLLSVALWLGLATFLKLPVSATHAVISAMIGAGMMANPSVVCWSQLSHIALAWVIAPVLSGLFSAMVHLLINRFILNDDNPVKRGLFAIPFIYSLTIGVNVSMIGYQLIHKLSPSLPLVIVIVSVIASITISTLVLSRVFLVPWTRSEIEKEAQNFISCAKTPFSRPSEFCQSSEHKKYEISEYKRTESNFKRNETAIIESTLDESKIDYTRNEPKAIGFSSTNDEQKKFRVEHDKDTGNQNEVPYKRKDVEKIFSILQILSAVFTSFAHGSNDVSNSIGPLFGLINAYRLTLGLPLYNSDSLALYGLLAFGGVGMIVGLFAWGARVIETLGTKLTSSISPSKGFSIELGSALTVLGASIAGLSVSTTHCKVGAIVAIGLTTPSVKPYSCEVYHFSPDKCQHQPVIDHSIDLKSNELRAAQVPEKGKTGTRHNNAQHHEEEPSVSQQEVGNQSLEEKEFFRLIDGHHPDRDAGKDCLKTPGIINNIIAQTPSSPNDSHSHHQQHDLFTAESRDILDESCTLNKNTATGEELCSSVNWRLIGDIFASWICTIPFAGILSAGFYFCFAKLNTLMGLY